MNDYETTAREIWGTWYEQDYQEFIEAMKEAIINHISIFNEKNPKKEMYGYSIYTCNGLPHIGPVVNSVNRLEEQDFDSYYKYCPDEWSDWDDFTCFNKVNNILDLLHNKFEICNDKFEEMYEAGDYPINKEFEFYWEKNVEKIFNVILKSLTELKEEGFFDWLPYPHKLILVWFSDPCDWEFSLSKKSVETLMGRERADEFYSTLR